MELHENLKLTLQQALIWEGETPQKFIMVGNATKQFQPLVKLKYIDPNHLKFCGAIRLLTKGREYAKTLNVI